MQTERLLKIILRILCIGIPLLIFHPIFTSNLIAGGDYPYYWSDYLNHVSIPLLWSPHWPSGLGGNQAFILPLRFYLQIPLVLFHQILHLPGDLVQKFVLLWICLGLALYSSYALTKSWVGMFLYSANTWFLIVFSGGQSGVALSYAIAPLVFKRFLMIYTYIFEIHTRSKSRITYDKKLLRLSLVAGLLFAIQVMFDIRVAYIQIVSIFLYMVFFICFISKKRNMQSVYNLIFYSLAIPIITTALLHTFWLLPLLLTKSSGASIVSFHPTLDEVKFFSFAKLENSISLLHPNWPENIFGKVYFMKPEFLILPLLAYLPLLFISKQFKKQDRNKNILILFFSLLGLLGAFLAKGANEPFGSAYLWLFSHVPGFSMFRDPVKFYIPVAIAFSVLIPESLSKLSSFFADRFSAQRRIYIDFAISLAFIILYLILIRQTFFHFSQGILQTRTIPAEYYALQDFLREQKQFSRVLWMPAQQRFAYVSDTHPSLNGYEFFHVSSASGMIAVLQKKSTKMLLQEGAVKYVILPYDSEKEIFLTDRTYDDRLYNKSLFALEKLAWLKKERQFGKLVVFSIEQSKDHFWSSSNQKLLYGTIDATKYILYFEQDTNRNIPLVFSERFDPNWYAKIGGRIIPSKQYNSYFNSFEIPPIKHTETIEVFYKPQDYLVFGMIVSFVTFVGLVVYQLNFRIRAILDKPE
jgi:hypothetical protein